MTKFHVLAAVGDFADELRSLGLFDAASPRDALVRCLAQLDRDPVDREDEVRDPELADLLRRVQHQLRDALAEPDVSFIVTPVAAKAHFVPTTTGRSSRPARSSVGGRGCGGSLGWTWCTWRRSEVWTGTYRTPHSGSPGR